jgi:hypothetical protein
MRNLLATALLFFTFFSTSRAQGFFIKGGLGYAIQHNGEVYSGNGLYNGSYTNYAGGEGYKVAHASFGSGTHGTLAIGYMINKHVGIELSGVIGITATKYSYNHYNDTFSNGVFDYNVANQAKTPVILLPSVIVSTGGKNVSLYVKAGLALPVSTKINHINTYTPDFYSSYTNEVTTWTYSSRFSLGYSGSLGLQAKLSDNLDFWLEARVISLTVYAKKGELKDLTYDGKSYINNVNPIYKTVYFDNDNSFSSTAPYYEPAFSVPFSSAGLNAGLTYTFGKKKHIKMKH